MLASASAFALLFATAAAGPDSGPDASGARIAEITGNIDVQIMFGSSTALATDKGAIELNISGDRIMIGPAAARNQGDTKVSFGSQKLDRIIAKNGARVVVTGFNGKTIEVSTSGGSHVKLSGSGAGGSSQRGTASLRIDGAGTSRVDADGLSVDDANVALKDAARAEIKVTRSLTCDLQRASRLVVKGKPAKVDKKVAGVAKLELK